MQNTLSSPINTHPLLASLARIIRTKRLLRGAIVVWFVALAIFAVSFLLDFAFGMSASAMRVGLAVWLLACSITIAVCVAWPLVRRITPQALAAKLERQFPHLGERLTTATNIAGEAAYGSQSFKNQFHNQTKSELDDLDVRRVVSIRPLTPWLCAAAVTIVLFGAALGLYTPMQDFTQNFFGLDSSPGPIQSHKLGAAKKATPVRILSAKVSIKPPGYVNGLVHLTRQITLPNNQNALQFGTIAYELTIDRPFIDGQLTFRKKAGSGTYTRSLKNSASGNAVSIKVDQLPPGHYMVDVNFKCKTGASSHKSLGALHVKRDAAPMFAKAKRFGIAEKLVPSTGIPQLRPDETLPIIVEVYDNEGLQQIELQYRVNDGPLQTKVIARGFGMTTVSESFYWALKGHVKIGDTVSYRIKAFDNRNVAVGAFSDFTGNRVPPTKLDPHIVFDPAEKDGQPRWYTFRIDSAADSFAKQDILDHHAWLLKELNAVNKKLRAEQVKIKALAEKSKTEQMSADDKKKAAAIQGDHEKAQQQLQNAANTMEKQWPFQALAGETNQISKQLLEPGNKLLKSLPKDADPNSRGMKLRQVDSDLGQAQKRIKKLLAQVEEVKNLRLDQLNLEKLANQEEKLAADTAKLKDKNPNDPKSKQKLEDIKAKQQSVRKELKDLKGKSSLLQNAVKIANAKKLQQMANDAKQLAMNQEKLNADLEKTASESTKSKLDQIIEKQKEIVSESVEWSSQAEIDRFVTQSGDEAVANLQKIALRKAMKNQLQFGQVLQDWATRFSPSGDKVLVAAAAQALAKRQIQVVADLKKLAKEFVALPPLEFDRAIDKIKSQQTTVRKQMEAVWAMAVKSGNRTVLQKAREGIYHATVLMDRNDFYRAVGFMKSGAQALSRSADEWKKQIAKAAPFPNNATAKQKLAKTAQDLAGRQLALRAETAKLLANNEQLVQAKNKLLLRQKDQQMKTAKLQKGLHEMAQMSKDAKAKDALTNAAQTAKDAKDAMKKAEKNQADGKLDLAKKAGKGASDLLQKTSQLAMKTAKLMLSQTSPKADKAATALKDGEKMLKDAQKQLNEGKMSKAQSAMNNAAKALRMAAKQALPRSNQSAKASKPDPNGKKPNQQGAVDSGTPTSDPLGTKWSKHIGKSWGELPGVLRTELLQEMRARYGSDYAQIIRRYFQQIADVPIKIPSKDK